MTLVTAKKDDRMKSEMQQLAKSIVGTVREPLVVLDGDLRVRLANRSFYRTFRVTREETEGVSLFGLGDGHWDIPELRSLLLEVLPRNSHIDDFEVDREFPVIGRKVILLNACRLHDETRRAEMILLAMEDVTERRRAEAALRAGERRFRSLIENSSDAIALFDAAGAISYASPSTSRVLGYEPDEMLRFNAFDLIHPDDRGLTAECLAAVVRQPRASAGVEARVRHKDGSWRWLEGAFTNLLGEPSVAAIVNNYRDITARRELDAELKKFAAKLEASNRELQDFASVASHDLQEPLRKIQAFGDRLAARCYDSLGEEGRDYLRRMQSAAGRMQNLINDLLTFARVESKAQPFAPVALADVVRGVVSDLEVQVEQSGARIEVGELPVIEADPLQMRQLFQNLIGNSLKYRQPGTAPEIRISAGVLDAGPRPAQGAEGARPPGPVCRLCVADNGIGFDEKYLDRIFTVFQRLHGRKEYEGTGVGLAVCRKIAERHGGSITAHSSPGAGATFVVTLPIRQKKEAEAR